MKLFKHLTLSLLALVMLMTCTLFPATGTQAASQGSTTVQGQTLVKRDGEWYYLKNGAICYDTTLVKFNGQWYLVENGKVAANTTTIVEFNGGWYYVYRGRVAKEATTLVKFNNQWYYVENGKVAWDATTIVEYNGGWYYVYRGKVATQANTLVKFNNTWYYVKNGKVSWDTTTLVQYNGGWYYVYHGKLASHANTLVKYHNKWYYVKNGKVAWDTTAMVEFNGGLYYVYHGRVASDTTTLVEDNGKLRYVENGKFTNKTMFFDYQGKTYSINKGIATLKNNGKVIYLTFDDGPGPHTERLLKVLEKYNVKATFFVCNTKYTYLLDDIVDGGHTVAIHSRTHNYSKIYASESAFYDDLYYMQKVIYEKTGVMSYVTRFPGGSSNAVSKRYCPGIMTKLTKSMKAKGFRYFDWTVDSNDAGGTTTTSGVVRNVTRGISRSSGTHHYVLQHDVHGYSVNAVEQIIQWGLEKGYTFQAITMDSPACEHNVNN